MIQPHLKLDTGVISPYVLVCGDPARAAAIAALCRDTRELAWNREYRTFTGIYEEQLITVTSHGVGSAGAAICFEELIKIGAKVLIRVGTCGSLVENLGQGDHIVATGAVREDGISPQLIPIGYPAIADLEVVSVLEDVCRAAKAPYQRGVLVTSDVFYPGVLSTSLETYAKAKVPGVEMECATLFIIAALRQVRAGAIATIDGNPLKWDQGEYDPHGDKVTQGKARMLELGLKAMAEIARRAW